MKYYISNEKAEALIQEISPDKIKVANCDCGQSYAIEIDGDVVVICDDCHNNAPKFEKY